MDARALLDIHVSGMFQADSKISMKKHGAETGRDASEGDGISRTDVPATGTRPVRWTQGSPRSATGPVAADDSGQRETPRGVNARWVITWFVTTSLI